MTLQLEGGTVLSKPLISPAVGKRDGRRAHTALNKMHVSRGVGGGGGGGGGLQSKQWRMIRGDRIADGWGRKRSSRKSIVPFLQLARAFPARPNDETTALGASGFFF